MLKNRSLSLSMVVLVLLAILLMQSSISYSTTFGRLDSLTTDTRRGLATGWLVFSIWYWIIDPPRVEETQRVDEPWDFLFPQRADSLPFYESWLPRYTDYLYLAFTTSFAFSPTDVLPLTRRAKMLMLLQSAVSIITLTGIAGSAINILAGAN